MDLWGVFLEQTRLTVSQLACGSPGRGCDDVVFVGSVHGQI